MTIFIFQIIIFSGWIGLSVLLYANCIRKIRALADTYNITFPFRCKKCSNVINYNNTKYVFILWKKRRNMKSTSIVDSSATTTQIAYREYRLACPHCKEKTWQMPLKTKKNKPYKKEHKKIISGTVIKMIVIGFLSLLFLMITKII